MFLILGYGLIFFYMNLFQNQAKVKKTAQNLIRRLCRENPSERIGNLRDGIKDIKNHRWFAVSIIKKYIPQRNINSRASNFSAALLRNAR